MLTTVKKSMGMLLCATALLLGWSCVLDVSAPVSNDTVAPPTEVVLSLVFPDDYLPPMPAITETSSTRALDFVSENTVDDIYVLVFNQNNALIDIKRAESITPNPGPDPGYNPGGNMYSAFYNFTATIITSSGNNTTRLVVLANSLRILTNTIGVSTASPFMGQSYDNVIAAITDPIATQMYPATTGRIPMWGEMAPALIRPGTTLQALEMTRCVARIDVGVGTPVWNTTTRRYDWNGLTPSGATIPFRLVNVTVIRPNNRYAVVPAAANHVGTTITNPTVPPGTASFPVAESRTNFTFTGTGGAVTYSIYTPEADVRMSPNAVPGDTNHTNRMAIVVGGNYNNSPTVSYYRLDFAYNGALLNVLRNHLYMFNISGVNTAGHPTVEEAYNSQSMNMSADVIDWDRTDFGNIIFDGQNYFAMNSLQIHFTPQGGQSTTVNIQTSVTDFALNLGGTTRLRANGTTPVTYTEPSTGFTYTLVGTGGDNYTLTVSTPTPNVATTPTTRLNQWTVSAGRLNQSLTVDQAWANPYVSVVNGATTRLYPEGTNNNPANNLPLNVASASPITVSVVYSPAGAPTNWLQGVVTNPPLVNGVYAANMSLSVDPFVYGPNNTVDRMANIYVSTQGGQQSVYTIMQQAPYIMLSPNNVNIPHPAAPTTVDTPVAVVTNIPTTDLAAPPTQTSTNVGLTYQSAVMPYTIMGDVNSRDRRFIVRTTLNQTAVNYTGAISSTFSVVPNSAKYGTLPAADDQVTVAVTPTASNLAVYWNQIDFNQTPGTFQWKANTRYSDQSQNVVVPWNATRVAVDAVSNMSPVPDTAMGTTMTPMTPSTVDMGNGSFAYAWQYTIPQTSYALGGTYTISFHSTNPPGSNAMLRFQQGVQYIAREGGAAITVGFRGTADGGTQPSITLRSNVNWTASMGSWVPPVNPGGEWLSMSVDGSAYSPFNVTREDRQAIITSTGNYLESRDLLAAPHTVNFSISPVPDFNPQSGFTNGMRSATVSFVNNSYDSSATDRRGAPNPAPIVITQYAPILYNAGSTLPVGNDRISASATSYTFTANTNLQGWGVRAYDGPYTPGKTPIASQDFAPQNPGVTINPAAPAQPYNTTLNLPANTSITNSRPVYFYLRSNEFPNHDPASTLIGMRNQDYMSPNQPPVNGPGGGDFIIFDANNRLQIGNVANGTIAADLQGGNVSTNLALFKFGSAVGFDGNGQFGGGFGATSGSIRFNPISGGRQINSWGDILAFNNQANPAATTAPGTYIGDANYSNYNNLRNFGMHDPCRLIGYSAAEVRAWTEAQYNTAMTASQWRIATAIENVYLIGGSLIPTFNPTNPPTNWIRNTIFGYTWSSIVGYSYSQGTGPNDWNFEVPNVLPTQINLPVAPGGQPLTTPGIRVPGSSIRYSRGELGFDSPLLTNFWSGTVAYNSYDTGQLAYSVVRNLGVNIFPSYQRGADFGMSVRCVRRN